MSWTNRSGVVLPVFFAPLQGLTDHVFRRTYEDVFSGVKEYFTPFIRYEKGELRNKDKKELAHVADEPKTTVQVLPANGEQAVFLVKEVLRNGCTRVDINMGCPFPKVVRSGAGAGLLCTPQRVEEILHVVDRFPNVEFSLKMRCGLESIDELWPLLPLINAARLRHVVLHPRTAREGYGGMPHHDVFERFSEQCDHRTVYNGNIVSIGDVEHLQEKFPRMAAVMVGRGLVNRPDMLSVGLADEERRELCRKFYNRLYEAYACILCGESQILMKMQTLWQSFLTDADKKLRKKLLKTRSLATLEECAERILDKYEYS